MGFRSFLPCKSILFLCIIFVTLVQISSGNPGDLNHMPQIQTSTYHLQTANFLGKTYDYVSFETQYDDDVYVLRQWACPCVNGSIPCAMDTATVSPPVDETGYSFTVLTQDQWHYNVIDNNHEFGYFKFEFNPDPSIPCPILHLDKETETGTLSAFFSNNEIPSSGTHLWYSPYFGYSSISICPNHPNFTYGTYYGILVGQRGTNMNSNRVRFRVTNSPSCIASYLPSAATPTNSTLLEDGIPHISELDFPNQDFYMVATSQRCTFLAISINKLGTVGDGDLYVSTRNTQPSFNDPSSHQWHSTVDGDDRVNIQYCNPDASASETVFYLGVRAAAPGLFRYAIIATFQQWEEPYPIANLTHYQSKLELSYGSTPFLNCSDGQFFTCGFPTYASCFQDGFDCCYRFGPVPPTQTPQSLWPWNEADPSIGDLSFRIPWNDTEPSVAGKLAWYLQTGASTPSSYEQFFFGDPGSCVVVMGNSIVSRNGTALTSRTISFSPKPLVCSHDRFQKAASLVDDLSSDLLVGGTTDFEALSLRQLRLSIASLSPDLAGCEEEISNFAVMSTSNISYPDSQFCYQIPGSAAWEADACCNPLLLAVQCCAAQDKIAQIRLPMVARNDLIESTCRTPQCSEKTVDAWAANVKRTSAANTGCDAILDQSASLDQIPNLSSFITECRTSLMGPNLMGVPCKTSADCQYSAECLPITKTCNHTDDNVIDCLAKSMSGTTARILYNIWNLTEAVTLPVLRQQLSSRFSSQQCVGPTAMKYREGYHWAPQVGGCEDQCSMDGADPYCFDRSCPIPPYCDAAQVRGACYRFWEPRLTDLDGCVAESACNWSPADGSKLTETECLAGSAQVCLDCSRGKCLEVDTITTQSRCEQGLCSADASVTDPAVCSSLGVCATSCPTCNTQAGCEASGVCSDSIELASQLARVSSTTGLCIAPPEYNSVAKSYVCPDTESLENLVSLGCVLNYSLSADCTSSGFTDVFWYQLAQDSATCTSRKGCKSTKTGEWNLFNQAECELCNSSHTWQSYFEWKPATWQPGTIQSLVWTDREYGQINNVTNTINWVSLMSAVSSATTSQYAYAYRTHALCTYDSSLRLIGSAACDCTGGGNDGCFSAIADGPVGTGLGCSALASTIITPVATLAIQNTSFPPGLCSPVELSFTAPSQYQLDSSVNFNQAIFKASSINDFWLVENENGAKIGQIISGGVTVSLKTDLTGVADLCIVIDSDVPVARIATRFALAALDLDSDELVAFGAQLPIKVSNGSLCAPIKVSGTYFAAKVVHDYDTRKLQSASEIAQVRIAAILFLAVGAFAVVQTVLLIMNRQTERILKLKLIFIAIIFIDCIIRAVYVSLPGNSFKPGTAVVQFIIFELPTFLFFSVFTAIVYLWLLVVAKTGVLGNKAAVRKRERLMKRVFIAGNALMYIIFIVFIVLVAILPRLQKSPECFLGGANADTSNNSAAYKVKLAYWIFEAIICITVSIAFLTSAIALLRLLTESNKTKRKSKSKGGTSTSMSTPVLIITVVAVVSSVVLLIRSAIFLWSAQTRRPVNVLAFAFLECVPLAMILFYLHPFSVFRENSTASNTKSMSAPSGNQSSGWYSTDEDDSKNSIALKTTKKSVQSNESASPRSPRSAEPKPLPTNTASARTPPVARKPRPTHAEV